MIKIFLIFICIIGGVFFIFLPKALEAGFSELDEINDWIIRRQSKFKLENKPKGLPNKNEEIK